MIPVNRLKGLDIYNGKHLYTDCSICKRTVDLGEFDYEQRFPKLVDFFHNRCNAQDLTWLNENQREILISGICGKCFDDMFKGEDDE